MNFLLILILVWAISLGAWWLISRSFKNADVGKIRSRLVEPAVKKKEKKSKTQQLIHVDEAAAGQMILGVLQKFELRDRLHTLLEQAGLKWMYRTRLFGHNFVQAAIA